MFAATASAGYVHTIDDLVHAVVATALGAVVGGIASLAPWIVDPVRRRVTGRPTPVDDATVEAAVDALDPSDPASTATESEDEQ